VYSPTGDFFGNFPRVSAVAATPSPTAFNEPGSSSAPRMAGDFNTLWGLPDNSKASGDSDWFNLMAGLVSRNSTQPEPPQQTAGSEPERFLRRTIVNQLPARQYDPGASAAPLAPSVDPNYSGGLLGRFAALGGIDPNQPAPPPDDEQEQADMRALEARLSSSGNIRDAVALHNARRSSRR
jgi:hypothetical protein